MSVIVTNTRDGSVREYDNLTQASADLHMHTKSIRTYAGNGQEYKGYMFRLVGVDEAVAQQVNMVEVVDEDGTGVRVFDSVTAASKDLRMAKDTIRKYAGTGEVYQGMRFRLVERQRQAANLDAFTYVFGQEAGELFAGKSVRHTNDLPMKISVLDVISLVCDSENPSTIWKRLREAHGHTPILSNCNEVRMNSRPTPVTDARGLIELVNLLPGPKAAAFRAKGADILVRFVGGDESLVQDIRNINALHEAGMGAGSMSGVFREAVTTNVVPALPAYPANPYALASPLHHGKTMFNFEDKKVCYLLIFFYNGVRYIKFGCTNDPRERMLEHISSQFKSFPNAYIYTMVESSDIKLLETRFKRDMQGKNYLTDLVIDGKRHVEILANVEPSEAELHLLNTKMACDALTPNVGDQQVVRLAEIDLEKERVRIEKEHVVHKNKIELVRTVLDVLQQCGNNGAALQLMRDLLITG